MKKDISYDSFMESIRSGSAAAAESETGKRRTALAVMQSIGTRRLNHARTILAVTVSSAAAILAAALIPAMTEERHPSGTGQEIRLSSGPAGQTRPDEPRLYTAYRNSRALRKFIEQNSNGK